MSEPAASPLPDSPAPDAARTASSETTGPQTWQKQRRRGGRAGNLFFAILAKSRVGLLLVPWFLFWVALYFVLFAPRARRASLELARRLGRRPSFAFCFRQFYGFGRSLIDRIAILGGNSQLYSCTSHGREHLEAAIAGGKGVVLLTAHLGNWEVMAQLLGDLTARVTLVMYDKVQPELRATLEKLSEGRSFRVLFTDGSPAAAAGILAALGEGDIVGLMGDRVHAGKFVRVPLLDGEVPFPIGPYALAAASGAPLVHVFAVREASRRYGFYAFPAETLRFTDRRNKQADLQRWAGAFAERVEEFLRRYPEQWGNLFSLWEEGA